MLRKAFIALSVAANLLVVAAIVWLLVGGGMRFVIGRFITPAHAQRVSHFEAFAAEPGDVVFLGDSITEGGRWEEIFPGARARNRGIGGDTTTGVLARLEQVSERRPAQVFLLIGTNDLFAGVPEAQIAENVAAITTRLRAGSPEAQLFVQSVLPRAAKYRARVESLNARLREIARDDGATFVDLYPHFLDARDGSIRDDLSNDELHLMGPGYRVWREQIAGYVRPSDAVRSPAALR